MNGKIYKLAFPTALLLFAIGIISHSLGQGADPAAVPAAANAVAAAAPQAQTMTLGQMWVVGGFFMYPIAFLSVAALALTILGFLNTSENKMIHMDLVPAIKDNIMSRDIPSAIATCTGNPSPMTNILHAGLRRITEFYNKASVEKAMEESAVEENTVGLRNINYLSIIATTAPMFGLLGTVSGMIKAFQKIGLGGMGDPEKLATDIGEAMITTAFGLIVGIPAMFFYFDLKSKFSANMARIGRVMGDLTHDMDQNLPGGEGCREGGASPRQG
ncbi:MAG: MotA/TolQ/ExbB proton channel family protein [Kiritimatiellia bacterium]